MSEDPGSILTPAKQGWKELLTRCGKQGLFNTIQNNITEAPEISATTFASKEEQKKYIEALGINILHFTPVLEELSKLTPPPPGTLVTSELMQEFREMKQQIASLNHNVAYLSLGKYVSKSHIAVYNDIEELYGFHQDEEALWKDICSPDPALVQDLWDRFDSTELDRTEPKCQLVMVKLMQHVLIQSHPLRSWNDIPIPNPDKKPDISITSKTDISLSWRTLLVPFELEAVGNFKEGIGQVISYMTTCLIETRKLSMLGVFSDGLTINILRVIPRSQQPTYYVNTGLLDLFQSPKPQVPTAGFHALIRLLSASLNDLGAISHPPNIVVGQSTYKVVAYIADGCKSRVYKCSNLEGREVVVKSLLDGSGLSHLLSEAATLRKLKEHDPGDTYFPTLLIAAADKLVLTPYAPYSLRTYVYHTVGNDVKVYAIVEQIIKALKVAHNAKVLHNDIRPSNIVIDEKGNNPRIIDWGLSSNMGDQQSNKYGTLAYAATKFLTRITTIASAATDLESVVYVLLFLKTGHLPWYKAQTAMAVSSARKKILDEQVVELLDIVHTHGDGAHDMMIEYLQGAQNVGKT